MKRKVAVFLPQYYRGGVLRGAKNFAKSIAYASRMNSENIEVIFSCVEKKYDLANDFRDLNEYGISVRETLWKAYSYEQSKEILNLYGRKHKVLDKFPHVMPCDGISDFLDIDLWIIITDRLELPLLPIKDYICVNYDYIQRYVPEIFGVMNNEIWNHQVNVLFSIVRNSELVLVNTTSTMNDLISYAGVAKDKTKLINIDFEPIRHTNMKNNYNDYFVWVTNSSIHKNHKRALEGLRIYYEELEGKMKTLVLGGYTEYFNPKAKLDYSIFDDYSKSYFKMIADIILKNKLLLSNIRFPGYVSDAEYAGILKDAEFLLHTNLYDNGTYSVIEAAYLGTPSLSSKYPPMEYIDQKLKLNLTYFDPFDSYDLALKLKSMEEKSKEVLLPDKEKLESYNWKNNASEILYIVKQFIS